MAVEIRWNLAAYREIRTRPQTLAELDAQAEALAARAGDGYEARGPQITGGRVRGRAAVITATVKAARAEARDHNLLRALGGGGGG